MVIMAMLPERAPQLLSQYHPRRVNLLQNPPLLGRGRMHARQPRHPRSNNACLALDLRARNRVNSNYG